MAESVEHHRPVATDVALDLPQTYVSDIEQKKRGLDLLQVLDFCQAFDVKFEDFAVELMKRIRARKA